MAAASLASYDGSAGVLVDTNVWVDCIDDASPWHEWALDQLQACSERAPLHVNLVIYTELLVPEPDVAALDELLDVYDTQRSALPWSCAALAAATFPGSIAAAAAAGRCRCPISTSARTRRWRT